MRSYPDSEHEATKTPLRVLFFEDDADDVALSLRALSSSQYTVTSDIAATPEEFLERLRSRPYDIILSDFRMPGATGMDIFEMVKKEGLDVPFILVTGSLGDEKAVECLKEGVADYVIKDRLARLPVAVRRALEERALRLEHAQAEQALRRSEASYRSLIQSAPCGILRLSARDGGLIDANTALAEMLGYSSPSELIQSSVAEHIALDEVLRKRLTEGCARDGRTIKCEVEWKRRDGTPLCIGLRGRLLWNESGNPSCLEMIAENVTEQRSAQERICQLNRLYSVLSDTGQAIIRIREPSELFSETCRILIEEGQIQMAWVGLIDPLTGRVNRAASYPPDAEYLTDLNVTVLDEPAGHGMIGTAIRENRHAICNDLTNDLRMRPWLERAKRGGYRSVGAFPLVTYDHAIGAIAIYGPEIDFFDEENIALLDELAADLSFALESMETDRTRQRAVAELDQFFALSLDMLCISNLDGYMRRVNPAWEKTLGFSADELASKPWIEFVHPEDRPQAEAVFLNLQSGIAVNHLEVRFLSKSGAYRWLVGTATPVVERGLAFAAVSDITERRHLEEQLRNQNVVLEQQIRLANEANRLKSEFLANMSHELRSPLNGIIGFTELLWDGKLGPLPERPRTFVGRIHASASHLLHLINSVLDLSKVEAGRLEFWPESVLVSSVIQQVLEILHPLATEKEIQIETEIEYGVDQVTIDPARLKQILFNYVSNALKFTGQRGRVQVKLKAEGAGEFRIEVSDTGVGISKEDFVRLFVEFQQLDASKSKRYQGTGLGLALTKRIVELQGGRVGVESTPGKGSTFFAVLPRVPIAQADASRISVVEEQGVQPLSR